MFELTDYVQSFNFNGRIRKLEVFRPGPGVAGERKDFILLEDLRDHYDISDVRFERDDGVALTFMRDNNLQRYVPERISARRGSTINIVSNNTGSISTLETNDSKTQHSDSSFSRNHNVTDDSQIQKKIKDRQSKSYHSIIINIPEPQNPHVITAIDHVRTVQYTGPDFNQVGSTGQEKGEFSEEERKQLANLRQETEGVVINVLERHKEALVRFALILAKAEEILSTSYDFDRGNGPRFFVMLPDLRHKWDETSIQTNRFRLFFLCECGLHTSHPNGDSETIPTLHLADHEGYVVRQPAKFIERFGPYLLVMLEMLKFRNQIADYALPGLLSSSTPSSSNTISSSSPNLDRINKSIEYLETMTGLDSQQPWNITEFLKDVKASDGVDFATQLASYVEIDMHRNLYANMYRMKSLPDRADWVCRIHHPSKFEHAEYYELESTLSSVGARLDHLEGKISATVLSKSHADQIFAAILRIMGLGYYRLELKIDWNCSVEDMARLERLVGQADITSIKFITPVSTSQPSHPSPSSKSEQAPPYPSPTPDSSCDRESDDGWRDNYMERPSSRTDSLSSEMRSPIAVNGRLPDWAYTYHDQYDRRHGDGRSRHSVESAPYMLPNDLTESDRLDAQHYIVRYMLQGNYNVKLDRKSSIRILDVATGTGVWAIEMANEFPLSKVYGIDLSAIYPTPETSCKVVPPNCEFQLCNILDGLPFPDNYFDFVYQRLLVYALTPAHRKEVNSELFRVLKPGGHVQLVESDGLIYNSGQTTDMVNILSLETAMKKGVDPKEVQRLKPGLRRAGFSRINAFHIALPIGDWGGPLGQLSQQNMHGLAAIWLKGVLGKQTEEECEATLAEIDKECEQYQSFYKTWLVVGQKPSLNPVSPTVSSRSRKDSTKS